MRAPGAGSALFNLCLEPSFAAGVRQLGALPKLQALMDHPDLGVQAAVTGVLMNCCASSSACREDLASHGLLAQVLAVLTRSEIAGTQKDLLAAATASSEVLAAALALHWHTRPYAYGYQNKAEVLLSLFLRRRCHK